MKHLKNHTLKCLALIAATSLIGGCSVREATPIINAKPIDTQNRPAEAAPVDPADADARIKNLDPDALSNKRLNAKNALDLLNEVVKPLSEALLAPAAFTSVDTTSSMEFFRALRELNEGIYKLDQMDAKLLKESGVLPRYQKALYYDCDINLRGNCPNLNLYAREARFGTVLTIIAKDEADVLKYYRLLYTALERFRSESDQNLNFMYLDRHQELARLVLKDKSVPGSAGEQEAMRLHSRVLSNILQDFDIEKVSKAQMDRLMANFNPWDASRKTEGIAAVGIDKLLGWAANGYLYTDKTKTKLDPTFVKRVVAILDGKDDEFGLGLRTIYNDIQKSDSKRILENFRLVSDFEPDEYIYLVDRIYYAHFTIDDGMAMWKVTGRDRGRLFKALNIFARLQIANMIVWTNREMNKFFEESPDKFKDVLGLLRGAVNNSLTMHAMWDRTLNRVEGLIQFVDREYGQVDTFSLANDDDYKQFKNSVRGLRHNIKMLSVYPNMMMIVYLMAKKDFQATINTWWGTFTITPYDIIRMFFINVMSPWFSFGTDSGSLSQAELLYAVHFALVTETFSSFRKNPVIPVDEAEFFREVVEKLTNEYEQKAVDARTKIAAYKQANVSLIREGLMACVEERVMQNQDGEKLAVRGYQRAFSYDDFGPKFSNGLPTSKDSQYSAIARFYDANTIPADLTLLRTYAEDRALFVRNMYGIIQDYVQATGGDQTAVRKAYETEKADFEAARNEYLKELHDSLKTYGDCDRVLLTYELRLRDRVVDMEEAFVGQVYQNLVELNQAAATDLDAARARALELNREIAPKAENGLPQGYVDRGGYDAYVESAGRFKFNYHQLDAKLRARRHLREIAPNVEVTLPNFDRLQEYQNPTPFPLTADGDKATFIDDAMGRFVKFFFGNTSKFSPSTMLAKVDIMAQLYRLGPLGKDGAPGCADADCLQVLPEDVIKEALSVARLWDMSPEDAKLLRWLGTEQLHEDKYWSEVAMEEGTRRSLGLLDIPFQRVMSDTTERTKMNGAITTYFLTKTKSYYDTETSVGNFFFPPRPEVKQLIKRNYSGYVSEYEERAEKFFEAYEKVRRDPEWRIDKLRRTVRSSIVTPIETTATGEKLPVYLTVERRNRYTSAVNSFHDRTSFEFKQKH